MDLLATLPLEVAIDVLSSGVLDPADLARAACVDSHWNALVQEEVVWRSLARRYLLQRWNAEDCVPSNEGFLLDHAIATHPPLIRPDRANGGIPAIDTWRTYVTLHHLSSTLFGRTLDGQTHPTSQPNPVSVPLAGQFASSSSYPQEQLQQPFQVAEFRSLGSGLIVATGVAGGLIVQSQHGDLLEPPLWELPPSDVPAGSAIETDGTFVVLVSSAQEDGPTTILQVFTASRTERGSLVPCTNLTTNLHGGVSHFTVRHSKLIAINQIGTALQLWDLPTTCSPPSTSGTQEATMHMLDLGHARLQSVSSLDFDPEGGWAVVTGSVSWGALPSYGISYLLGSDAIAIDLQTGNVLWSLVQGPYPVDRQKRAQYGFETMPDPFVPAITPEYYRLSFPSWCPTEQEAVRTQETIMHHGHLERLDTFQGDRSINVRQLNLTHWSYFTRLQYRRTWNNVQMDRPTGTLLISSGATLAMLRNYPTYFTSLNQHEHTHHTTNTNTSTFPTEPMTEPTEEPMTEPSSLTTVPATGSTLAYIELPEPQALPYDLFGRVGPYVPSGYGTRLGAGWRTHWSRTRLRAHDGWALWDGHTPILLGYGTNPPNAPLDTDLRSTLLWPDDAAEASEAMRAHNGGGERPVEGDNPERTAAEPRMRSVVPISSAVNAQPALEMAVEARSCTAIISPFAAYRLRPFRWADDDQHHDPVDDPRAYHFCLQRWTFGHQAQQFLSSLPVFSSRRSACDAVPSATVLLPTTTTTTTKLAFLLDGHPSCSNKDPFRNGEHCQVRAETDYNGDRRGHDQSDDDDEEEEEEDEAYRLQSSCLVPAAQHLVLPHGIPALTTGRPHLILPHHHLHYYNQRHQPVPLA